MISTDNELMSSAPILDVDLRSSAGTKDWDLVVQILENHFLEDFHIQFDFIGIEIASSSIVEI